MTSYTWQGVAKTLHDYMNKMTSFVNSTLGYWEIQRQNLAIGSTYHFYTNIIVIHLLIRINEIFSPKIFVFLQAQKINTCGHT